MTGPRKLRSQTEPHKTRKRPHELRSQTEPRKTRRPHEPQDGRQPGDPHSPDRAET